MIVRMWRMMATNGIYRNITSVRALIMIRVFEICNKIVETLYGTTEFSNFQSSLADSEFTINCWSFEPLFKPPENCKTICPYSSSQNFQNNKSFDAFNPILAKIFKPIHKKLERLFCSQKYSKFPQIQNFSIYYHEQLAHMFYSFCNFPRAQLPIFIFKFFQR